jgi:hypothetical protein
MPQVAPFFISKKSVAPFFVVTWPPNLSSSDTFKGISGPDSDEKLVPNIIDKYKGVFPETSKAIFVSKGGFCGQKQCAVTFLRQRSLESG